MSDVAKELAVCLDYARLVARALPIDEEADRAVAEAMRRNEPKPVKSTKLLPRRR